VTDHDGGKPCVFCADRHEREEAWIKINDKLLQERTHSDQLLVQAKQDFQRRLMQVNDKRIAAETRASELAAALRTIADDPGVHPNAAPWIPAQVARAALTRLRCSKGEHCWATSGGKTECNDCGVLG